MQSEADRRHVDALMRPHVIGSTPNFRREELIEFISSKNGGSSPDAILENIRAEVVKPKKETHAPPTSQLEPAVQLKYPTAVWVPCAGCNQEHVVKEDLVKTGQPLFCAACAGKLQARQKQVNDELTKWCNQPGLNEKYYDCEYNNQKMLAYIMQRKGGTVTVQTMNEAMRALDAELLKRLTVEQVRQMTDKQFDERARLEGSYQTNILGGIDLATMRQGQPRGESIIHSSNKIRFRELPLKGISSQSGRI
jgi:hypothetical protein